MASSQTRAAFAAAAARDGILLAPTAYDWLCEQGHVGLERVAKARRDPAIVLPVIAALEVLSAICARLRGDVAVLAAAREQLLLPIDLAHAATGTIVEVDGREHFTSARLAALGLYPADVPAGFDIAEHRALCRTLAPETDALQRGLAAKAFGFGGVARERAYHDALRDLAAPAMGLPPVVRIAAVDGDGEAAYARHRERLLALGTGRATAGPGPRRPGSCTSVAETLIVRQRPQRMRTR